jgi:uncharacterized membrane protein
VKDSWLFPVVQSVHLVGLALLVGTIVLVDLRLLGSRLRREEASRLAAELAPWTRAGIIIVGITGPLMFWSDIPRYVNNPAFLIKMGLLLLAVTHHFTTYRWMSKLTAVVSLILWSSVVLAGRAIADFDIRVT